VTDGGIRFGLLAVKNVGVNFVSAIIKEREKGKFESYEDFLTRMSGHLNRKMIESLIYAGALDLFPHTRSEKVGVLDGAIATLTDINRRNVTGQMDLFSESGEGETFLTLNYPDIAPDTIVERLNMEKSVTGVYLSGHPLDGFEREKKRCASISDIKRSLDAEDGDFKEGSLVNVIGISGEKKVKDTRRGDIMAFFPLYDVASSAEVVVFPKVFDAIMPLVEKDEVLVVRGEISTRDDDIKILAREVAKAKPDSLFRDDMKVYIRLKTRDKKMLDEIVSLVSLYSGKSAVVVFVEDEKKTFRLVGADSDASDTLITHLKTLIGNENVVLK
jgi:DNA polymerase-3 subunit alpha